MNHSENINELATALAVAQGQMKPAKMNATNPFLKNKYADLGAVMDACRDVLSGNGLSFVQMAFTPPLETFGPAVGVETMLMHMSGQWLSEQFVLPVGDEKGKSIMQVAGSAISYARRYALASMLGIVADEDSDGNSPPKQPPVSRQPAPLPPVKAVPPGVNAETGEMLTSDAALFPEPGTPDQWALWRGRVQSNPKSTVKTVCNAVGNTGLYSGGESHAINAAATLGLNDPARKLTQIEALDLFDLLVARKVDAPRPAGYPGKEKP